MPNLPGARPELRERGVLAWGAAALFLAGWADVSVKNVAETLFLKRIGVELLPVAFLANAGLLLGTTSLLGLLASRMDPLRLFTGALAALAALLLGLFAMVEAGGSAVYPALLIAAKQISAISLITFSMAAAVLLDPRQAKRRLAPLLAGGTLGSILGSFASAPLGRWLGVEGLLPVSAAVLGLGAVASIGLRHTPAARQVPSRAAPTVEPVSAPDASVSARSLWRESWLFRALVVSALMAGAVGPILYFQFSYVADQATRGAGGEERLLALYAQLRGWLLAAVLVVQLFVAPRLYRRVGLVLAGALSPLLYLLGFAGLTFRLGLVEGVASLTGVTVQDNAVHDPAQRVLIGLFPDETRGRVATFVEGTAKRAGAVVGNLLVMGAIAVGSPPVVGLVGVPLTLVWFAITLQMRRRYPALLLSFATGRRGLPAGEGAELLDSATLRRFGRTLCDTDLDRVRAALAILRELRPDAAVGLVAEALPQAPLEGRSVLLAELESMLDEAGQGDAPRGAAAGLGRLLSDSPPAEPRTRAALLRVYARLQEGGPPDAALRTRLAEAEDDAAPAVRLAAAVASHRLLGEGDPDRLAARLDAALRGADAAAAELACAELQGLLVHDPSGDPERDAPGQLRWHARLGLLVAALFRPETRTAAAEALAGVAARHGGYAAAATAEMLALADDPEAEVRAAALRFLGGAQLAEHASLLVERLAAPHAAESRAAREGLRLLGPAALDALLPALWFGRRSVREALVPLLRELDVDREAFEAQLRREVEGAAEQVLELAALRDTVAPVVEQHLQERIEDGIRTSLLILSALHDDERIAELGLALDQPASRRERALRVEALEARLPPAARAMLVPLLEDPALEARVRAAQALLGRAPRSRKATLAAMMMEADPLTRTLLVATGAVSEDSPEPERREEERMALEVDVLLQLRSVPLFERLSVRQLADVARLVRQEEHAGGRDIVKEGSHEASLYLITSGRVRVTRNGVELNECGPGEYFGELSLLDGEPRSATVSAIDTVRSLRIERGDLLRLMEEVPGIAIAICQKLTQNVRQLSARVMA